MHTSRQATFLAATAHTRNSKFNDSEDMHNKHRHARAGDRELSHPHRIFSGATSSFLSGADSSPQPRCQDFALTTFLHREFRHHEMDFDNLTEENDENRTQLLENPASTS